MKRPGIKRPTWTHLVTEALRTADDFLGMEALKAATQGNIGQVSAALHHLQKCKVVGSVEGPEGLFWFYRGEDTRSRELDERVPEDKPRRPRRARKITP